MASYKVVLVDASELRITADDVDLEGSQYENEDNEKCTSDNYAYFNFWKETSGDESVTVAAIPYMQVRYITS